jgi:hypothetical protein
MRISDADRKATQERLHSAHAEGLISLEEFDSRVSAAWQATTRGELAKLSADLPQPQSQRRPKRVTGGFRPDAGGTAMRVLFTIWLSASLVNLIVWGLLVLTVHWVHPWWVWVVAPPGAVLGVLWYYGIGRRQD